MVVPETRSWRRPQKRQPGGDNSVSVVRYNGLTGFAVPDAGLL